MAASEAEIREFCLDYLRKTLDIATDQIVPDATFARLGLDSASSVHLLVELEDWLGLELTPDVVAEYPSVDALAKFLAGGAGEPGAGG